MGNFLRSLAAQLSGATPPAFEPRLLRIVGRQRELKGAEVQEKLSRQARDPCSEQPSEPLYGPSAYGGAD